MEITTTIIEQHWPLSGVTIEKMPKQGMGGQVGIIVSDQGKFTYKIAGSWKKPANLERDLVVYEFLNQKSFPNISTLLKTRTDERFVALGEKLLYLIAYVEGEHPAQITQTYAELGKITSALHSIKDFPFETDYRPATAVPDLIANSSQFIFQDEYCGILKSIRSFKDLPLVPIHTEITPGNVIQQSDGKIIVIDWDEAGLGPAVLDLGVALINHFVTEDLEILEVEAKAYYFNYFTLRPMKTEERSYVWDAALFWACSWITYGNQEKRWERIKWAINNREKLESFYKSND